MNLTQEDRAIIYNAKTNNAIYIRIAEQKEIERLEHVARVVNCAGLGWRHYVRAQVDIDSAPPAYSDRGNT